MTTVYRRTRSDAKKANRDAYKGMVLYVINEVATNIAPYEDSHLKTRHVVTHRQAITGAWMIAGSLSVEGLVLREGPVYTVDPDPKVREIGDPSPQVAGPDPRKVAEKAGFRIFSNKAAKAGRR
ncbi:hypothetical protein [Streptomyces formicae]|uniref:Phage protein n=1 Tax=Streptomyces formicae TaxID=1616117 RepID=A0ABY3WMC1_9ACTN|nr:hypothetical protein [Streptomyces formicae]UNM13784.1 hypothetical protein J4032_22065 [Streptomyces formicae]